MGQTPWIERKFNFDFPAGLFPVILARLQGALPRIKDICAELQNEQLVFMPEGKWSIQQHIGHLSDLEELHLGRIADFKNRVPELRAWDGINKKTEEANHNAKTISAVLQEFSEVRNAFIEELQTCSGDDLLFRSIHPRLQVPMRLVDMAFFVAEHDDHHIAKMWSAAAVSGSYPDTGEV
jgi:uncharacterized damage-inducible protein DinB